MATPASRISDATDGHWSLFRLQQGDRAVGGVAEGVVNRRVDRWLVQREFDTDAVASRAQGWRPASTLRQ
jgi:hypothetical protein